MLKVEVYDLIKQCIDQYTHYTLRLNSERTKTCSFETSWCYFQSGWHSTSRNKKLEISG